MISFKKSKTHIGEGGVLYDEKEIKGDDSVREETVIRSRACLFPRQELGIKEGGEEGHLPEKRGGVPNRKDLDLWGGGGRGHRGALLHCRILEERKGTAGSLSRIYYGGGRGGGGGGGGGGGCHRDNTSATG